ncbi:MAG TPA: TlpA disulfide reductase family protein [Bacteroidales bacterium]|nr:TlpA disulfide reductase family protein [Bacteroidales bacterium]
MLFRRFFVVFCGVVAACLLLTRCGNGDKPSDEFVIHGKLKSSLGEKIILQQLKVDSIKSLDSVTIDENGEFTFKYTPPAISFYLLKIGSDNFITLLANKGEQIEMNGDARQLATDYSVSGSKGSALLCELNNYTRKNSSKTDSLYKLQILYHDSANFAGIKQQLDSAYECVFEDQRRYVQDFIRKNRTSLASLVALYQVFGRQKVLNERDHFGVFKMLDSTLFLIYPGNEYVLELHTRVENIEKAKAEKLQLLARLDSGMTAPDIKMNNIGGYPQSLSSLKGRVILIFFWAALSPPSISVLKQLKWTYKNYREKGFQVYAVSLDKNRRDWEFAVREHNPGWINASDLLGWDSPVVRDYCIDNIPYAVLIGRDGRILKRGITTEELPQWLYKIFKP